MADEDLYRRQEDRQWRERTDERLAALTSGETVQNDRLDELEERAEEMDAIMRGDPQHDSGGILEHMREIQAGLNSLRALMAPDALGSGGVINRLKMLEAKDRRAEKISGNRLKFWIAILGFVSATTVALITNLDRLAKIYHDMTQSAPATPPTTKRSKRSGTKKRVRLPPPPVEPEQDTPDGED